MIERSNGRSVVLASVIPVLWNNARALYTNQRLNNMKIMSFKLQLLNFEIYLSRWKVL